MYLQTYLIELFIGVEHVKNEVSLTFYDYSKQCGFKNIPLTFAALLIILCNFSSKIDLKKQVTLR